MTGADVAVRSAASVPGATRVVIALTGVGLAVVPSPLHPLSIVLTVLAGLATAIRPHQVGALVPTAAFGIGWLAAGGWHADPDPVRTVVAAALLFVLHQSTALASLLPLGTVVAPGVLRRWVLRCGPAVAIAAAVAVLDLLVSTRAGSPAVEVGALLGVLVVLGLVLRPVLAPASSARDERAS
ncbi:hypothetical protein [Jatrophihabitans endophyticus]|uniref:hypothetical protein n=1 Tax=Jatrophihabitans endophyticus TaxID=1206085 RepID=UPI0019EE9297|nr:hypothetical protein [Jatrophihabitans endophyticus]MBE7187498.1 hypothetical protein [Jatrophihabitans endophyticus]